MPTYLDRYLSGEREVVWRELTALGPAIRDEPLFPNRERTAHANVHMGIRRAGAFRTGVAAGERELTYSRLLDHTATIAGLGRPLEPLQSILHLALEALAAKLLQHPTPPTWRKCEVSAKLQATGGGV